MKKNILYGSVFCVISVVGIVLFYAFYHYTYISFEPNKIKVSLDQEYWATKDVKVTVDYTGDLTVREYSFDGGKTWQKENVYIAKENKNLKVMLKGYWGLTSQTVEYNVDNIDKEIPMIEAEDIIYTAVGKEFDINNHYEVLETVSGIKKVTVEGTDLIDTTVIGEYEVSIDVLDIAGNINAKTVTVAVVDAKDPNLLENKKEPVSVTGITVDKNKINLITGAKVKITPTVKPLNATNKKIVWKSVNTSVAKVDANGVITAVGAGTTTVTATTVDGEKKSEIKVVVSNDAIAVQSVALDRKNDVVTTDTNKIVLTPTIKPENATNQNLTWSSTNPQVASVKDGVVTIRSEGDTTIVAASSNGKMATYHLVVRDNYGFTVTAKVRRGEIQGYRIIIWKNGIDITEHIDTIVEPFKATPERMGRIEITPTQYKSLKDTLVIYYNERKVTIKKINTQE